MITVTDISMAFGGQMLFEQVNLQLNAGNCYGIVGGGPRVSRPYFAS